MRKSTGRKGTGKHRLLERQLEFLSERHLPTSRPAKICELGERESVMRKSQVAKKENRGGPGSKPSQRIRFDLPPDTPPGELATSANRHGQQHEDIVTSWSR